MHPQEGDRLRAERRQAASFRVLWVSVRTWRDWDTGAPSTCLPGSRES